MDYLHLTIPYIKFEEKFNEFRTQLQVLVDNKSSDVDDFKTKYYELHDKISNFLNESFNQNDNFFLRQYKQSKQINYNRNNNDITIETYKKDIALKLGIITSIINLIKISDLIISPSDELYQKRQRLTIRQKRELVLLKISQLDPNRYHSIDNIYLGNGLLKGRSDEPFNIGQQLEQSGYVDLAGAMGGDAHAQITLEGIEYIQEYTEPSYGLYDFDEELTDEEKNNLKEIFDDLREELKRDIKDQFKDQQESITTALNALYEVLNESIEVIDSKLPQKSVRQLIFGKIVEKGGEKAFEEIMKLLWGKLKAKLIGDPDFSDLLTGAEKFLNS